MVDPITLGFRLKNVTNNEYQGQSGSKREPYFIVIDMFTYSLAWKKKEVWCQSRLTPSTAPLIDLVSDSIYCGVLHITYINIKHLAK